MALQVVENDQTQISTRKGQVCVRSDLKNFPAAIEELQSAAARNLAIQFAGQKGLPWPSTGMPSAPYPTDEHGIPITDPLRQKIASYQCDIPVQSSRI